MTNPEHLKIMNCGVDQWNRWRTFDSNGKPRHYTAEVTPDLMGWDGEILREFDFHERFLSQYVPHPSELRELHESFAAGTLDFDLIPYGWKFINNINLNHAMLTGANLTRLTVSRARLFMADLTGAAMSGANFSDADFRQAKLVGANAEKAWMTGANFSGANLSQANFFRANLTRCNFTDANLQGADLREANLEGATFVKSNLDAANLSGSRVYGLSVWDLKGVAIQRDLNITPQYESNVSVDDLEMAQFIYLILNNSAIRSAINTLTTKVVLILGRFTPDRKIVLEAIRNAIRRKNYLPVLFDFERSKARDLTETISLLAHLSRFVVADLTDAKSIPQELQSIIPNLPSVPVQPIVHIGVEAYSMFEHLARYPWVLPLKRYSQSDILSETSMMHLLDEAEVYRSVL